MLTDINMQTANTQMREVIQLGDQTTVTESNVDHIDKQEVTGGVQDSTVHRPD